ncbi:uncharacterized protein LOC115564672 [Drosophila navojoa]|nr:uncharacterized protein LOC115564672 [Drosophila navojoa]
MDTPSFSPTLAWRSLIEHQEHIDKSKILNTLNSPKTTTGETPIQFNRTSQMKQLAKPSHILQNWTPEQDLVDENDDKIKGLITGDDSSSDDYRSKCEGDSLLFYGGKAKNVGSSIHTFSLSLPRDTHTQHSRNIVNLEVCNYKSLQKSRPENDLNGASAGSSSYQRTSSLHQQENIAVSNLECSNNWMLHKNVSGTENYTKSLDHGSKRQRLVPLEAQSIKFLTGGKHVMYLPGSNDQTNSMKVYKAEPKANIQEPKSNRYFKSRQRPMPQSLQDETPVFPIMAMNEEALPLEDDKPFHHRFWFNNPVRLLEKRLNADKSGKSSKLKVSLDGQIEALKKVEEDFQRNRANEKENIQHQLRLYFGTDDDQYQSLPIAPVLDRFSNINLNDTSNKLFSRDDPEGCVSMVPFTEHESNDKKITISSANI